MLHNSTLQLLMPLELGELSQADIRLESQRLDLGAGQADHLLTEMYPADAVEFLPTWEQLLGIAPAVDAGRSERVNEILFRLRNLGRIDRQFYIDIAATVGYSVTITELYPLMAGWAESGKEVLDEQVRWIWTVTITEGFTQYALAGAAAAGDPLAWYRDKRHLDEIFNDLKPAHTLVIFT